MKLHHFWILPLLSAAIWWGMLIALLACWAGQGSPVYDWMQPTTQTILYISDIAAGELQPIFISCSGASGLLFVLSLSAELYLRDVRRLRPGTKSRVHVRRALIFSIVFAVIGELGILFVSIFNTRSFHHAHEALLVIFIVFVAISSLSSVAEFGILETDYHLKRHVIVALCCRVVWFVIELALAIAFVSLNEAHSDARAICEWALSFVYPLYMFIMMWDLWPANNKAKGHYPASDVFPVTPEIRGGGGFGEPFEYKSINKANNASPIADESDEAKLFNNGTEEIRI